MYEDCIVNKAVTLMEGIKTQFVDRNASFFEAYSRLDYKMKNLLAILTDLEQQYDRSGLEVVGLAENYISQRSSLQYNLTLLSGRIHNGLAGKMLESFVAGLDSMEVYRLTLAQDMWVMRRALVQAVSSIWERATEKPYADFTRLTRLFCENPKNLTKKESRCVRDVMRKGTTSYATTKCPDILSAVNADWLLKGEKHVLRRLNSQWDNMTSAVDLITNVTSLKEELGYTVNNLKRFTFEFLEGNKISRKFVK